MFEPFHPFGEYILVRKVDPQTQTEAGIVIPKGAEEEKFQGIVKRLGWGCKEAKDYLPVGSMVFFPKFAGEPVEAQGWEEGEYLVLRQEEIVGVCYPAREDSGELL